VVGPVACWCGSAADKVRHLGLYQLLRQQPHAVAQEVRIRALLLLVEQVQAIVVVLLVVV
jgi:hypothetical protein